MTGLDAKAELHDYLRGARKVLLWKLEGLSEYDIRRPLTPTGTNLLGLVKHAATFELEYFGPVFGRPHHVPLPWLKDGAGANADMWATADQSREEIIALYRHAWQYADETITALPLDASGRVPWWGENGAVTLHRVLVHMTAETQRHAGHADIVRELIDGTTGFRRENDNLPPGDQAWWRGYRDQVEQGARDAAAGSRRPGSPAPPEVIVRDYAEGDYGACRSLWAELTEYHRSIYGDPSIGGDDPGAGFDDYLATPQRIGSWVAESPGRVVGLTGLFDRGMNGELEPVVVTEAARNQGIGSMLIGRVVEEARSRGYEYLAIRPVARNVAAVRRFHAAGFRTLGGHIDLTMDLATRRLEWLPGASLHGLGFGY